MSRDLILLAISLLAWGMGESAFFYFQPLYLEQLGASHLAIGAILSGVGIAMTAAHIPAGYLADRLGRRVLMRVAWFLGVTAALIMALAPNLNTFTIGILLYGLTAFVASPLNSYVTAARGRLSIGQALTITQVAYNSGAIVGPFIGGLIGENLGLRQIYIFALVVFVFSLLIILLIRSQPTEAHSTASNRSLLTNRRYLAFLPVVFLAVLAMYLPQPLTSNFLQNERGVAVRTIGIFGTLASLGNVVMALTLGQMRPILGFILGQLCVAGFAFLILQGGGTIWFAAGYILLGGYRAARMLMIAQVRSLVSATNMGLAYGITDTVSGLGIILAPILAGLLFEINPKLIYPVAMSLIGFSVLTSLYYRQISKTSPEGDLYGNHPG